MQAVLLPENVLSGIHGPDAVGDTPAWRDAAPWVPGTRAFAACNGFNGHQRIFGVAVETLAGFVQKQHAIDLRVDPEFRVVSGWYGLNTTRVAWKLLPDDLYVQALLFGWVVAATMLMFELCVIWQCSRRVQARRWLPMGKRCRTALK